MVLFWIFSLNFRINFYFLPAIVIGDIPLFFVVMVIADCSTVSRVNFSEEISSETILIKEKNLSLSGKLLLCRQLQPIVMRKSISIVKKRETRSS